MPDRKNYRHILRDPCNLSATQRNWGNVRDALEGLDEAIDEVETTQAATGDQLVPFVVVSDATANPVSVKVADREVDPWDFTIEKQAYDPSERVFLKNMKTGHYGFARPFPEQGEDALEIITLEGQVRFITGETTTQVDESDSSVQVHSPVMQFGYAPNGFEISADDPITMYDRLELLADQPSGIKVLGIYDEQAGEYIVIGKPKASEGDEVVPFVVTEIGFNGFCDVLIADRTETPWTFTIPKRAVDPYYHAEEDPDAAFPVTARGIFFRNMKVGHFGYARLMPEHPGGNDIVEIIHLEGQARFITGELTDKMGLHGTALIEYDFGAFPNSAPIVGEVVIVDRLGMMTNQPAGTPIMGVYDEDRDEYIAVGPQLFENDPEEGMHQVEVCHPITNDCCAFPGTATKLKAVANDSCDDAWCYEPVYVQCENRPLLPNFDWRDEPPFEIIDGFGAKIGDPMPGHFNGWGRRTGLTLTCNGAELPVYTVRCPALDCVCPAQGETLRAIYSPTKSSVGYPRCKFPNFDIQCVDTDPILGGGGGNSWWGEFEVTGWYPRVGFAWAIDDDSAFECTYTDDNGNEQTDSVDIAYVVWLPIDDNPFSGNNYELWYQCGGQWRQSGPLPLKDGGEIGERLPIIDDRDYVSLYPTTFRYGVYLTCDPNVDEPRVVIARIYHLRRDVNSSVVDDCDDLLVPPPEALIHDEQGSAVQSQEDNCCHTSAAGSVDASFGTEVIRSSGDVLEPMAVDLNGHKLGDNDDNPTEAYAEHVLGGCLDHLADWWKERGQPFTHEYIENGEPDRGLSAWRVFWSGRPDQDLC